MSAFKAPLDPSTSLGGFSGNNYLAVICIPVICSSINEVSRNQVIFFLTQASAFIVTYPVNNAIDKEGNDTKRTVAWEKAFIQLAKVCSRSLCIYFMFSS